MTELWTGTYRLQMHKGFPLQAAIGVLPYLNKLGISHVYLSPCLGAAPGSMHGYDVTNPTRINPELGGEEEWRQFIVAARAQGLSVLLDIVPNHMAASSCNAWWDDVLAHGLLSAYATFFDIRVTPPEAFIVQLCTLGQPYGQVLKASELQLKVVDGLPRVAYFDNSWPISPCSWGLLLDPSGEAGTWVQRMAAINFEAPDGKARRAYAELCAEGQQILKREHEGGRVAARISDIHADPARLHELLQAQYYRLHCWKLSGELSNYRRFFEVDSLVGVRAELPEVMEATHARLSRMLHEGELAGLRIDHPDGLRDPARYFKDLRAMLPSGRIYIEKILENEEKLNADWAVDGTVGYDFLSKVNRLWMDDQRLDVLTATYFDFTRQPVNLVALIRQKKSDILNKSFLADLARLSKTLQGLAAGHWSTCDLSPQQLHDALAAVTVALPIYRTYRGADQLDAYDRQVLADSVQRARAAAPGIDASVFDFLSSLLARERLDPTETDFVQQWQQLTPAVMAKGVEDTTFYAFDRLLSCNEVGASASLVGISNEKFHEYCHYLSETWPHNLLTTSTHDTKRSEDVRARISILSEIPERWAEALHHWSTLTEACWKNRTPDRHAEYLLYQTLVGAWPISKERVWQYILKACREAKIRTSWHEPNAGYEANIQGFTEAALDNQEFIVSLEEFIEPLVKPGRINSLAQTLIKAVAPGVPDFYQGSELWDLSLVDPDNRRPVDYAVRSRLLSGCESLSAQEVLKDWESGLPKLWLTAKLLKLRRERRDCFNAQSKYEPLIAQGAKLSNILAFRRGTDLLAAIPRLTFSINGQWGDTHLTLPQGQWRNAFTDEIVSGVLNPTVFEDFPVALFVRTAS